MSTTASPTGPPAPPGRPVTRRTTPRGVPLYHSDRFGRSTHHVNAPIGLRGLTAWSPLCAALSHAKGTNMDIVQPPGDSRPTSDDFRARNDELFARRKELQERLTVLRANV